MHLRGAFCVLLSVLLVTSSSAFAGSGLPGHATTDTVRTNLWLAEALFTDIADEVAAELATDQARVLLWANGEVDGTELFQAAAFEVLTAAGHEVFVAGDDQEGSAEVSHILEFRVVGVELEYPEIGRTLGIWRSWIGRDLAVSVMVELSEASSGIALLGSMPPPAEVSKKCLMIPRYSM